MTKYLQNKQHSRQPPLYFMFTANWQIITLTRKTKMVNVVNITPAKHQHVSIVLVNMLANWRHLPSEYSLTELLAWL